MTLTLRKLGLAFAISLGLNLFLAGFIAANLMRPRRPPPSELASGGAMLFHAGQALGDSRHPALLELMKKHRPALQQERRRIKDARGAVKAALIATPFEAKQLDRALAQLRQETDDSQALLHGALVELATKMTAEQRKAMAELSERPDKLRSRPQRRTR